MQHVARLGNTSNPELMYVFINAQQLHDRQYRKDIDLIAANGTFDFLFLTQRERADFYDYKAMYPIFKDLVAYAHARGIKVGLQLWPKTTAIPDDALQGIVTEEELQLDSKGHAECTDRSRGVRRSGTTGSQGPGRDGFTYAGVRSELLRVYAFRKSADAVYRPGSVVDITGRARVTASDKVSVSVAIDAPDLAGYTAYVMVAHYHEYPDLFSDFLPDTFTQAMRAYRDVGFDGAALDEFRYMAADITPGNVFRERLYTPKMAVFYRQRTGHDLVRSLFDMRYAPAGDPAPRIRAIDEYFDVLRQGPLRVEQAFAKSTTEIFGANAFHGIHDTFHNALENDEIWATGINWWAIPRDYGQTDETTPMTTRLGIGMAHPKPVEYNQYYTRDIRRFLEEGILDARYNVRVHYHALNDLHGWGMDLRTEELLGGISEVEDKVRLLNQFDAPRPRLNVLYVFGFPSLTNWFQKDGQRNTWDINGALHAEQKAVAGWNAGYRGALAPSYLIDNGVLQADANGGVRFGGERFTAIVFIGPEYSKESTVALLEKFVAGGGKLMLDGTATRDFYGNDVSDRFQRLEAKAVATSFSVDAMSKMDVPKLEVDDGAVYADGSVVLTDLDSLIGHTSRAFSIEVNGHTFSGAYSGLIAIKADASGNIVKLAAGRLLQLDRDGRPIVTLTEPSDIVLLRGANARYRGTVVGSATVSMPY